MLTVLPSSFSRGGGEGIVKILDMGLAKLHLEGRKAEELTGADAVLGTINYMAPEQISETHSADIRATLHLGCTFLSSWSAMPPSVARRTRRPSSDSRASREAAARALQVPRRRAR